MEQIDKFSKLTPQQAIEELFTFPDYLNKEPIDPKVGEPFVNMYRGKPFKRWRNRGSKSGKLLKYTIGWWVYEAQHDVSIRSKMAFFLHTCFTIRFNQTDEILPNHLFDYLELLNKSALGNYKELAKEIVVDNAMLEFLDNFSNSKENPNENFAREFLELFTIGKGEQVEDGNYTTFTEEDVRASARLLTGFVKGPIELDDTKLSSDRIIKTTPCRGEVDISKHDTNDIVFSKAFNNKKIKAATTNEEMWRQLDEYVALIFKQLPTAKNIVRRLYRYFVNSKITDELELEIIDPLARKLKIGNYEIKPIVKVLLESKHFFGIEPEKNKPSHLGVKIKSPMELILNSLQFFNVALPNPAVKFEKYYVKWFRESLFDKLFSDMGFCPFSPQDVAGYPAYYHAPAFDQNWVNSSTIVGRLNFISTLLRPKVDENDFGGVELDSVEFIKQKFKNADDPKVLVKQLTTNLFPAECNEERFDYFLNTLLDGNSALNWQKEWKKFLKDGDDNVVRTQLDRLIKALVNAPEYQVM